jgi:hypothetical protein
MRRKIRVVGAITYADGKARATIPLQICELDYGEPTYAKTITLFWKDAKGKERQLALSETEYANYIAHKDLQFPDGDSPEFGPTK